jgi:hypothetical protein
LLNHAKAVVDAARRLLQFPILTFGRGTQPHRMLEDIVTRLASLSAVPLEQTRITCSPRARRPSPPSSS